MRIFKGKYKSVFKQVLSVLTAGIFVVSSTVVPIVPASAQGIALSLPKPGTMVGLSDIYQPTLLQAITIHPDNPLRFDFIVSHGDDYQTEAEFKSDSTKLIKYFLASLTIPEDEMWVNLSPYEKDRIIPESFGYTEMGRDLLAQDYLLKQLTASLMYPEGELGQEFWAKVKAQIDAHRSSLDAHGEIQVSSIEHLASMFNKVWIVPDQAEVYERDNTVFVVNSHLKVMLEEDYLASQESGQWSVISDQSNNTTTDHRAQTTQVTREIIIPAIEAEINTGQTFANLRQIYHSMILATWYKVALQESLLGKIYMDRNKVKGVDVKDRDVKFKIYDQYLEAFKLGAYNYIKEEYDPVAQQIIPRKYFSGGAQAVDAAMLKRHSGDPASLPPHIQNNIRATTRLLSSVITADLNRALEASLVPIGFESIDGDSLKDSLVSGASYESEVDDVIKVRHYTESAGIGFEFSFQDKTKPVRFSLSFKNPKTVESMITDPESDFIKKHSTEVYARIIMWLNDFQVETLSSMSAYDNKDRPKEAFRNFNRKVAQALDPNVDLDSVVTEEGDLVNFNIKALMQSLSRGQALDNLSEWVKSNNLQDPAQLEDQVDFADLPEDFKSYKQEITSILKRTINFLQKLIPSYELSESGVWNFDALLEISSEEQKKIDYLKDFIAQIEDRVTEINNAENYQSLYNGASGFSAMLVSFDEDVLSGDTVAQGKLLESMKEVSSASKRLSQIVTAPLLMEMQIRDHAPDAAGLTDVLGLTDLKDLSSEQIFEYMVKGTGYEDEVSEVMIRKGSEISAFKVHFKLKDVDEPSTGVDQQEERRDVIFPSLVIYYRGSAVTGIESNLATTENENLLRFRSEHVVEMFARALHMIDDLGYSSTRVNTVDDSGQFESFLGRVATFLNPEYDFDSDQAQPFSDTKIINSQGKEGIYINVPALLSTAPALADEASLEQVGGIDFNPAAMNLQIRRDGNGVALPFSEQPPEIMQIEGLVPVIINIVPANMPLLLGLADSPGTEGFPNNDAQVQFERAPAYDRRNLSYLN